MSVDSVERIARALEGIRHTAACATTVQRIVREHGVSFVARIACTCDRGARQAAAVLEAIQHATSSEYPGKGKFGAFAAGVEAGVAALERLAGSPRDKEEPYVSS